VPEIQPRVGRLTLFQRTPPWVLPRGNPPIPDRWQQRFARHPRLLNFVRRSVFSLYESFHVGFRHPAVMKLAERRARAHIANEVADPELRAKLTPDYRLGCKRVLGSDSWYPALTQPNVEVVTAGIQEVTPSGIVDAEGRHHPVDTIIFGTGFHVTDAMASVRIVGRDGLKISDAWRGGMTAHLGTTVAGFPNLFLLVGPNTGLGHNSMIFMIEAQVRYIMNCLRLVARSGARAIEVRPQAQRRFNDWVQEKSAGSVWLRGGCASWYLDAEGVNRALWPASTVNFWLRMRRVRRTDFQLEEAVS
jgi:cation diffusion facilitator CzcD-associated flavoprotein CzcO